MQFNDEQLDRTIGSLLRGGVILAASVVLAGGIWYLAQRGLSVPDFHHFRGVPADLRSVSGIVAGTFRGSALSLIQLGLLLLVATPIARVGFSVFAFAVQRDRLYVCVTLIVLAILISSLFGLAASQQ
ncbi:MAG TPA: DUF1634 domain-containing protein [Candidatus Acidoferrales bacterium]|nr:DUF1634 domain-containing protein [Candidatus Acidoferrales bacterium]